jgi:integrase
MMPGVARRTAGITKLASGTYRWRVMVNGRRVTGTAETLPAARLARAQAEADAGGTPTGQATVGELLEIFVAESGHAASTANRRDIAIAAIPDAFKARNAADVTPPLVAALWRQMAAAGVGDHTVVKASHAVSRAFGVGVRLGVVPFNPARDVRPTTDPTARRTPLDPADVWRLIDAIADRPDLAAWVRFMAVCGARPGEACALRWDALDTPTLRVTVGPSIDEHGNVTAGKNGPSGHRAFEIDQRTFTALRRVPIVVGCPWVFNYGGRDPWRPKQAARRIRRVTNTLGIEMTPYDLRHFAATRAIAGGMDIPEVAYMLGDNPATVMKTYAHAIPGRSSAASAVAAALDESRAFSV